jgi:hypothetical protein
MEFSDYIDKWRRHCCTWMPRPDDWVWQVPGAPQRQGFGLNWRDPLAGANLLWLALDMDRPPTHYNARLNPLYMLLVAQAPMVKLNGVDLVDQAASLTLRQFFRECETGQLEGSCELTRFLPVITLLAHRRLDNAHA